MKTIKRFDDTLRMQIIEEHLQGSSKYSLVKKYKLYGSQQISVWMRIFGIENKKGEVMSYPHKEFQSEVESIKALQLELKLTKKALAEEKLRALAFDTMIDIAEKQFNIAIRKKAGTRQSKR